MYLITDSSNSSATQVLASYAKQVEEFASFGDMVDIQKYLRKAKNLDEKLQTAQEKVDRCYC